MVQVYNKPNYIGVALAILLIGCVSIVVTSELIKETNPDPIQVIIPEQETRVIHNFGWRTPSDPRSGASPLDVLNEVRKRIEYEQTTHELGNDANARALVEVLKAIAILDGKQTEVDGIPLIQ